MLQSLGPLALSKICEGFSGFHALYMLFPLTGMSGRFCSPRKDGLFP